MEVKSCRRKEGWTRGPTCSIAKSSPLANRPKTELAVASKASLPRLTPRCVMPRSIALDVVRVSAPVREGSRPERAERAVLLPLPFRQPAQARLSHLAPTTAMPPECLLRDGAAVRKGASPEGPRWPRQSCMTSPHADPRGRGEVLALKGSPCDLCAARCAAGIKVAKQRRRPHRARARAAADEPDGVHRRGLGG
jgi:hypothetical protein